MLKTLYVPEVSWRQLPPLLCLSFGALMGLVLAGFVLGGRYAQQQSLLLEEYGTGMARLVANTSVDAALGRDLISLHALLREATQESRVMMATVHDVDNALLVQAGQPQSGLPSETFEAGITVDENLVGRITLTLEQGFPGDAAVRWTLMGTGVLLALMVLLALYESYGVAWQWRVISRGAEEPEGRERLDDPEVIDPAEAVTAPGAVFADYRTDSSLSEPSLGREPEKYPFAADPSVTDEPPWPDDAEADADSPAPVAQFGSEPREASQEDAAQPERPAEVYQPPSTPEPLPESDLIVVLPNRKRLQEQLANDRFKHLMEVFELRLEEVLALYGGIRVGQASEGIYCVRFSSTESFSEAAFRALCSAHLLQSLGEGDRLRLQILAQVCAPDADIKLAVNDTGIYLHPGVNDQPLSARLRLEAQEDGRLRLLGFEGAYAGLLQRQQQQLLVMGRGQLQDSEQA